MTKLVCIIVDSETAKVIGKAVRSVGEPLMTAETIAHVTAVVAEKGTDAWWTLDTADLLPPSKRGEADNLKKGEDTMVRGRGQRYRLYGQSGCEVDTV